MNRSTASRRVCHFVHFTMVSRITPLSPCVANNSGVPACARRRSGFAAADLPHTSATASPGRIRFSPPRMCAFGRPHPGGATFALAGGSVRFVRDGIDAANLRRLCVRNGGEVLTLD